MKTSNTQCPFQALFNRFAAELQDALDAMRGAQSEVEFELAMRRAECLVEEFRWLEWSFAGV